MRGLIEGLENPHPLRFALPVLYQEDDFTNRFVSGFDDVIAPVLVAVDCIDSYLDPALAPLDFVVWLAGWVGLEVDENWSEAQLRRLVSRASELASWRGTRRGLLELLTIYGGVAEDAIDVDDNGGVTHSVTPNGSLPGDAAPRLVVRLRAGGEDEVAVTRVERLVALTKPAHVPHEVEVSPA